MKSYLEALIASAPTNLVAIHLVREYLQARILQSLQRAGAMQTLAFHGGTSLRFLYEIPRYKKKPVKPTRFSGGPLTEGWFGVAHHRDKRLALMPDRASALAGFLARVSCLLYN